MKRTRFITKTTLSLPEKKGSLLALLRQVPRCLQDLEQLYSTGACMAALSQWCIKANERSWKSFATRGLCRTFLACSSLSRSAWTLLLCWASCLCIAASCCLNFLSSLAVSISLLAAPSDGSTSKRCSPRMKHRLLNFLQCLSQL